MTQEHRLRHALIKPSPLRQGGTIGVVAPAGWVDMAILHHGVNHLENLGFRVILGKHLERKHLFFAGEDWERAEDFKQMFLNKEVDAVFCARGGVGAARIIPFLDQKWLAGSRKIFIGSSDITSLLLYMSESLGDVAFHGPMVATQFGNNPSAELDENVFKILAGESLVMQFDGVRCLQPGSAEGILTGGCLTLTCTSIGTPYEINTDGKILFIEDVNEAPFRIDRMLSYLKTVHKFDKVRGVLFGQMPKCAPEQLPDVIRDVLKDASFPILFGFPSGHGDGTATLPFGTHVQLDAVGRRLTMLEAAVDLLQ